MSDPLSSYASTFIAPKGPGDARPTALQILRDNDLENKWSGKVVLVTGATSGLGIETARALHATGADVFITARDSKKAQVVIQDILKSTGANGLLEVLEMDMNSLDSVKKAAEKFLSVSKKLNVLVNNAGVMATPEGSRTAEGFEEQFGVNHLAHFTLTTLLLPTLLHSSTPNFNSRVIVVTSNGHRFSSLHWDDINLTKAYDPWIAYGQSKTATIWMANYIDRVYGPRGVHANSVFPGGILTGLQKHMPAEHVEGWRNNSGFMDFFMSPEQGAATTVWAAAAKYWEGKGGKYLYYVDLGKPAKDLTSFDEAGYAPHAFDEEGEDRLWKLSTELTGVKLDE